MWEDRISVPNDKAAEHCEEKKNIFEEMGHSECGVDSGSWMQSRGRWYLSDDWTVF